MASARVKLGTNGRLVIPAPLRRALGVEAGDTLILESEGGALNVRSLDDTVRHAQSLVAKYLRAGESLADELIEDRRQEAAREGEY